MLRYLVYGLISLGLGGLLGMGSVASAAQLTPEQSDLQDALQTTPQGIPVSTYFDMGTSSLSQARVVPSRNSAVTNTEAVRLTNGTYQVGAVWSKPERKFDLNQDQTLSMWVYLGNQFDKAADGMAFVLQNDKRGKDALTKFPSSDPHKIQGETLGVWGVDNNNQETDGGRMQQYVADSAIQNSWALEFDTHLNTDNTLRTVHEANSFDLDKKNHPLLGPHIASNYPGDPKSYFPHIVYSWIPFKRYASTVYQDKGILPEKRGAVKGNANHPEGDFSFLSNGQWHHVTLTYEAQKANASTGTGQMTYSFDDRDPHSGIAGRSVMSTTVPIDKHKIDPDGSGKALWGFTGATGAWDENNLVVFDQIPSLVKGNSTATLLADGKEVNNGDVIDHGSPVQLDYRVQYQSGSVDWQKIAAQITLPQKITFKTVTITNANGQTDAVLGKDADLSTGKFTHQLANPLSKENPWVTISFTGKVQTQSGSVAAAVSEFNGTEAATETTTPQFNIDPPQMSLQMLTATGEPFDNQESVTLTGLVDLGNLQYRNSQLHIESWLNGKRQDEQSLRDSDEAREFHYNLAANSLRPGNNSLEMVVVTADGLMSNPLYLNLTGMADSTGGGEVSFSGQSMPLIFNGQLTGRPQELFSQAGFALHVTDSRLTGSWQLQAQVAPLTDFTTHRLLAGNLIYKSATGPITLTNVARPVMDHENQGSGSDVNVADSWSAAANQGLFLHLSGGAVAGNYQSKITWTLLDTA
ncbi:lectin-like domain-containing protein [Levilactobacillus fujinensis]|uniref:Extracellular protein n=1 Tax=Levilactobacillus fujinensis TaxID=2486024 RepID=A0ABW1TJ35_9LACO|nr:hypothetical protein [Levilactobacillus fujinensis]